MAARLPARVRAGCLVAGGALCAGANLYVRASGAGRITVRGDPARRTLTGKRVSIVR